MTDETTHSDDRDLITRLRAESGAVRDCFTQFSFNAIALSCAALGVVLSAAEKLEYADFAVIPFIGLLVIVSRIGIYKYATSNRLLGYELHLFRSAGEDLGSDWQPHMRQIDWEAALRAWRVVQPAIFRSVYKTPEDFPKSKVLRRLLGVPPFRAIYERSPAMYRLRPEIKRYISAYSSCGNLGDKEGYPWFYLPAITRTLESDHRKVGDDSPILRSNETGLYHAGSYLRHMLAALASLQLLLLVPMILEATRSFDAAKAASFSFTLRLLIIGMAFVVILVSKANAKRRREMIENGLLSIHSCAIIWQAVILAHFRALPTGSYDHYTEGLVQQAMKIANNPFDIHSYIRTGDVRTNDRRTQGLNRTDTALSHGTTG